jgi:mycothiol system anti-sigma-R factor
MPAIATGMRMMMRHEQHGPLEEEPGDCAEDTVPTCAGVTAMAWSYLDDELPWCDRRRIRSHVAGCDPCRAYLHFQRAFLRAVRAELNRETASDALRQRVSAALDAAALAPTRDDDPA